MKYRVLVIIDVVNDFCTGSFAVKDAEAIIEPINRLMHSGTFDLVAAVRDWHPRGHVNFAENHPGRKPFETILWKGKEITLWPTHCIENTEGASFHPGLDASAINLVFNKGIELATDSLSGFFDDRGVGSTGLHEYLQEIVTQKGITRSDIEVCVVGLALDYCVAATARDSVRLGYTTSIAVECCRGVNTSRVGEDKLLRGFAQRGIHVDSLKDIVRQAAREPVREVGGRHAGIRL